MESKLIGNEMAVLWAKDYLKSHICAPLLISGEKGLGQELLAMEIAAELLKTEEPEKHGNFYALRAGNGSIRVEDVDELLERSRISAHSGSKKVFVIFGMGSMTKQAQNRLLKLLEDRNITNVVLMTQDDGVVLDTIVSRSVSIRLHCVSNKEVRRYLVDLGESEEVPVYEAVLRGHPYLYEKVKGKIDVFRRLYREQLGIQEKQELLYLFHEVKEKDKESFYEKHRIYLPELLNMEFSIFKELFMGKLENARESQDEAFLNLSRLYEIEDVNRILKLILEQKKKLKVPGQYTRNDFGILVRELSR